MMLVRLALRELWGSRRQVSIPSVALTLVVGAFFVLGAFQFRFNQMVKQEGRMAMGADLRIQGFRPLGEYELENVLSVLPEGTQVSRIVEFNTMLRSPRTSVSRFVQLHAVESNFPFYGEYVTEPSLRFSDLDKDKPLLIVPEDVAHFLKVKIGEELRIGDKHFELAAILKHRPGNVGGFLSFAPGVYIHRKHLEGTGLFETPGRIDYENYFKISQDVSPKDFLSEIENALGDSGFSIRTFDEANRGFQRLFSRIQLFGHIVVLTGLVLASFSIFGTLQSWYHDRRYLIALLRCFGATRFQVSTLLLVATVSLSLFASIVGVLIGYLAQAFLSPLMENFIRMPTTSSLPISLYLSCLGIGVLTTTLFSFLAMANLASYKPLILIRNQADGLAWNFKKSVISLLLVCFFFSLGSYLVEDIQKGFYLTGGLVLTLLLAAGITYVLFRLLAKLPLSYFFAWNYAGRSLLRRPQTTLLSSSLLFLISCLLSMLFVLESALQEEFKMDIQTRHSSLFVFDLGENDKAEVDAFLANYPNVIAHWAPWVTVRWLTINGREPTGESEDGSDQFSSREIQVTVASELPGNNSIVAGKLWDRPYAGEGLVEVSVTRPYALRRGINLGDRLLFNLYGVEFEALVTSFRQVRFTDFQPFFRFVFQDGYFDGLPFSYLASIETPTDKVRQQVLSDFTAKFPQISVIDLSEVKRDLVEITGRISVALRIILVFLLLVGMSLMAALAREKLSERRYEFATLKSFGANQSQLRKILSIEFSYLSFLPSFAGSLAGVFLAHFILREFFVLYSLHVPTLVIWVPLGVSTLVLMVGLIGTKALAKARPRMLLAET